MVNNFKLSVVNDTLHHGAYFIPSNLDDNSILVDIGANVGTFLIDHSKKFKNAFFFEASYENYLKCLNNIEKYGLDNCIGFNLAVYNETGKIVFLKVHNNNDHGSNSLIENHPDWTNIKQPVLTISLEDIFVYLGVDRINYLKCDIETAEYELLMNKDLSKIDYLSIELHCQLGEKRGELMQHLDKYFDIIYENRWDHFEITYKNKNIKGK
jgi:FkbM family methyltransferase